MTYPPYIQVARRANVSQPKKSHTDLVDSTKPQTKNNFFLLPTTKNLRATISTGASVLQGVVFCFFLTWPSGLKGTGGPASGKITMNPGWEKNRFPTDTADEEKNDDDDDDDDHHHHHHDFLHQHLH